MKSTKKVRINEEITTREVRLIGPTSEQLGISSRNEALQQAAEANLDLVEISPNASPPVCRIMDYGKFIFEQNKQRAAARKKQKQTKIKELKFRPGTDEGDYKVKLRNLLNFLDHGDKVKITLRFRGREMAHQEIGLALLKRLQADVAEAGTIEQFPKMEGRQMVMVISPKKK